MFQQRCNMFPSDSQLRSFMTLFTARAGSAACVIIGKMATATQRQNNTTKQSNHSKATRNIYSNPSRIQSNISVLTEIEVTLQSIQDIEHLHKPQQNSKNSHECGMTETIGLSKTQSKEIQLHSQVSAPFPDSSNDADNPLQWQVNLESATSQLFSNHCGTLPTKRNLQHSELTTGILYTQHENPSFQEEIHSFQKSFNTPGARTQFPFHHVGLLFP